MAKFFKRAGISLLILLIIIGLVVFFVHRSAQTGPEFYQEAMKMDVVASSKAGDELEKQIFDLHNEVLHEDEWSATFTETQLNGWLASDFPSKFQQLLPSQVSDPRVSITTENIQVAFRYKSSKISGIVTLKGSAFISEADNEIGIVLERLSTGFVPLPISRFTDKISEKAKAKGVPVRWTQKDGAPVMLFKAELALPDEPERKLIIKSIDLKDGSITISGTSDAPVINVEQSFHGYATRYFGEVVKQDDETIVR